MNNDWLLGPNRRRCFRLRTTSLLESGEQVKGFLCEQHAVSDAADISSFGGWRAYLGSLR